MSLDKKETYLWGTLLALVKEQLDAIDKSVSGSLGFWGKSRMQARNKEMEKFLKKLVEYKVLRYGENTMEALLKDMDFIMQDNDDWDDVTVNQINYVRQVLEI